MFSFWFAYMLAVTLFVGKIATFSFLIAPLVHSQLEREQAAKLLRVFFPRYYKLGIVCAIVALLSGLALAFGIPLPRLYRWSILWTIILLTEVFALKVLVPTVEATREARNRGEAEAVRKWEWAHKLSVRLNVLNLLLGLILIGLYLA